MADTDLKGRISAFSSVAHTDGTATKVAELIWPAALLAVDGYYHVEAKVWGGMPDGTEGSAITMVAVARVDAGAVAAVGSGSPLGTAVYTTAFAITGGADGVQVNVTAINGYVSGARIEAYGVEVAIT